jgi:diguanylate cyclase (GGDEF)-like protein
MSPARFRRGDLLEGADPRRLAAILSRGRDLVLLLDPSGVIVEAQGALESFAVDPVTLAGTRIQDLVEEVEIPRLERLLAEAPERPGSGAVADMDVQVEGSSWRNVEITARNELDTPTVNALVVTMHDVSERKEREDQLRSNALRDPLTKLPNRTLFADRLNQTLQANGRRTEQAAVLFLDIDDFKAINDRLGHQAGDQLIIAIAGRLKAPLRAVDTPARLGGDEFAVLLERADETAAVDVAKRILGAFETPFALGGEMVAIHVSIGVAVSSGIGESGSELLRRADMAMYAVKGSSGPGFEVFRSRPDDGFEAPTDGQGNVVQLDRARRDRSKIRALIDDPDSISTVYQPIVELGDGRIAGYEALSRFASQPDTEGTFSRAHRCGLGSFLEARAIAKALETPRPPESFLCLNLSPPALLSRDVQEALPRTLEDVVIEVTEQELTSKQGLVSEAVAVLRRRGARLAIDDAGAGYAGLKHLMDYSPDLIKLDKSLIQGSHRDMHKGALVESLVRYANRIGAATCAEGIESRGDLDFAQAAGIDYAQGYLLAKPAEPWVQSLGVAMNSANRSALPGVRTSRERLAAMIAHALSWRDIDAVLALVAMTVGADQAYLSRLEPLGSYVVLVAAHGEPAYDMPYPLSEYPTTKAVLDSGKAQALSINDPATDPSEAELLIAEGMVTALLLAVQLSGESIGLLEISSSQQRAWSPEDLDYLAFVSQHLAGALSRLTRTRSVHQGSAGVSEPA